MNTENDTRLETVDQIITNDLMERTKELLSDSGILWAVCGGFALDLFLEENTRRHGDIDICVFEQDRERACGFMLRNGWNVYEFRGGGILRPLNSASSSETGRNLMCVMDGCDIVQFYPYDNNSDLLYYEFYHKGIAELNYLELLFNAVSDDYFLFNSRKDVKRELSKAILFRNGIPYLAPELVLLFKASRADIPEYSSNFEKTFPNMNDDQRQWFHQNLNAIYPDGHIWSV